jgi:hypothetical protein
MDYSFRKFKIGLANELDLFDPGAQPSLPVFCEDFAG